MRLPTLEVIERPNPSQVRRREWWGLAIAVAVTSAVGLLLPHEPARTRVTISNPTDHRLYINTSTPDDAGVTHVAVVEPRSTSTSHLVFDRGPEWVLHVRTLGSHAGTLTASRTELLDGSFTIPISINHDLAAAGVPTDVRPDETGR